MSDLVIQLLQEGEQFIARPTYVESPQNFYVVPRSHIKYLTKFHIPGTSNRSPAVNDIVVFKSSTFKLFKSSYMRGMIKEVDNENSQCRIFAIDHGKTEEKVKFEDIFNVGYEEAEDQPPLALQCELNLCIPKGEKFEEEAISAFKYFLGDENVLVKIKAIHAGKLRVDLRNSNDDLATTLALSEYTYLGSSSIKTIKIKHKKQVTWKHRQLKVGETLKVRLQEASSFSNLYICTLDDYKDYLANRRNFTDYCRYRNQIDKNDFVVGQSVGVQEELNEPFERAIIVEIIEPGQLAKVRIVDWGREATVPISRVVSIQTEMFSNIPIRAIYCSALNPEDFVDFMPASLCKGYMYRVTIQKLGFEFSIPHLVSLK